MVQAVELEFKVMLVLDIGNSKVGHPGTGVCSRGFDIVQHFVTCYKSLQHDINNAQHSLDEDVRSADDNQDLLEVQRDFSGVFDELVRDD